jgi:hypothetical protein
MLSLVPKNQHHFTVTTEKSEFIFFWKQYYGKFRVHYFRYNCWAVLHLNLTTKNQQLFIFQVQLYSQQITVSFFQVLLSHT